MASLAAIMMRLYTASTFATLLFVFTSFMTHYGQNKNTFKLLSKSPIRIICISLQIIALLAEVVIRQPRLSEQHVMFLAYTTIAWALTCVRKQFLAWDLFGLACIDILVGIPVLALNSKTITEVSSRESLAIALGASRLMLLMFLLLDSSLVVFRKSPSLVSTEEESDALLGGDNGRAQLAGSYGTDNNPSCYSDDNSDSSSKSDSDDDDDADSEDEDDTSDLHIGQLRKSGSWIAYLEQFKIFLPHVIPKGNIRVQICLVICVLCIIGGRFLTVLIPQRLSYIVDQLVAGHLPYGALGVFYVLSMLDDGAGFDLIISLAKIPIQQFSQRSLTNAAFNHVMSLELDFHSDRDSAEVMKAIEQGEALTNMLDTAVLEMLPTIADTLLAFGFLYVKFTSVIAICMLTTAFAFMATEVVTSSWNIDNRRHVTKSERQQARLMHQAVQGWRTVSAFNMFSYEKFRFAGAVDKTLGASRKWSVRDAYIDAILQALIPTSFFILASLVVNEIYMGRSTPGSFVFLLQYWEFLVWPLKILSHEYRYLMKDLVDAERLLDLLTTKPKIVDIDGAKDLSQVQGRVEFENVHFAYDSKRTALQNITLTAAPGETIALVGTTGAGKSTVTKLLMRYYEIDSGCIKIDGVDISSVTQGSLRDAIGLVPQDPLLFNTTVMENLKYAKLDATDEDVYKACRAASIHDKILTFKDGYDTKVGEQGVKLSGGELQRLAIARVFLKNPAILVLDEATSAVDTETEVAIQSALYRLSDKRTTFVIAHRLSTVVRANHILVMDEGAILEQGSHQELMERKGKYFSLWQSQLGGISEGEVQQPQQDQSE